MVFFIIIFYFPRIAQYFFQRYEDNVTQFIFVLAMTFLGSVMMEMIGMEGCSAPSLRVWCSTDTCPTYRR
mgnify:FL=1